MEGDGTLNAKRSSNATESPAKTTSYNLTVVAYGTGNLTDTGKVSINDSQDFSTTVGGAFIKNTEITVKAGANPGYEFVAWRVTTPENPEATLSTNATHTFNLTSNLQLFAVFRPIPTEYSVAYHGSGAAGDMTGGTVSVGGTYSLKTCAYDTPYGKKFIGWAVGSIDATPIKQPGDVITINADTTIYAVWDNLYFTSQPTDVSGKIGSNVKLPVVIDLSQVPGDGNNIVLEVREGLNWIKVVETNRSGWNTLNGGFTIQQNNACTKEYQYKIYNGTEWINSDSFTVKFLPLVVTFVDDKHSTITEPIEVDTVGGKITKPVDPTYPGDKFTEWWANGAWNFENRTVTQDITLSASWANCGFYGDMHDVYAKLGEKARIDLSNVNFNGTFTYVYRYDGANWIQVDNVTNYGHYDLPASAEAKIETYKIIINSSTPIESNEFKVTWTTTLPTYTVYYGIGEGQGNAESDNDVVYGYNYTLKSYDNVGALPLHGMMFDYWSVRVGGALGKEIAQKDAGENISITSDIFVIAIWKNAPSVTVSYYSIGNLVDSDIVFVGAKYTLMDTQALEVPLGKQFKTWAIGSLGGEQKNPGYSFTIATEMSIYAIWEDIPHECSGILNTGQGATCTVDGWKAYYRCECGKYYEDADCQTPINDLEAWKVGDGKIEASHSGTQVWTRTATTHEKKYDCCGGVVVAEEGHEWSNGVCSECEYDCLHTNVAVTKKVGQGATCTVNGWKDYYQCACGEHFADESRTTPITNLETWKINDGKIVAEHKYGNLIEEQSAVHTQTELKAGMKAHHKCSVCQAYFDENKLPITEGALTIAKPEHIYGDWIKNNDKHWKVCSCGLKANEHAHSYTDNSDMICNDCSYDRTVPHVCGNATKQDGQDATCTVNGWNDYYRCSCGKLYTEAACTNEIASLEAWKNGDGKILAGHSYGTLIPEKVATCSATGMQAHYECSVCDTLFNESKAVKTDIELTIAIDDSAHTYGSWAPNGNGTHTRVCTLNNAHKDTDDCSGGTATCENEAICSICNTKYGEKSDHTWGQSWEYKADDGHAKKCTVCDVYDSKQNHNPNIPNATESQSKVCNDCGYTIQAALGHSHSTTRVPPTQASCISDGNIEYYTCTCGMWFKDQAATVKIDNHNSVNTTADHIYGDLIAKEDSTCSATGMRAHYECSVCHKLFDSDKVERAENELSITIDDSAHVYGPWASNGNGTHTRVCTLNNEHKENGDCSGGIATCTEKATCVTCGTSYGNLAQHDHKATWTSDANVHWNECECGDKANVSAHSDDDSDGKCDICNYQVRTSDLDDPDGGLSGGAIAGIVIGSIAGIGIGGSAIFWFLIKKKSFADLIAIFAKK